MTMMIEKQLQENYLITFTDHPQIIYKATLSSLKNPSEMKEFVRVYSEKLKAHTSQVAATYFCKYFGWSLAGFHYLHSLDYHVDAAPSNIELQLYFDEGHDYYGLVFKLADSSLQNEIRAGIEGEIETLYRNSVTPLLQAFVVETGIKIRELWGQLCIGLYFGYDFNQKEASSDRQKHHLEQDFFFLTKKMDTELFNARKNPLDITFKMIPNAHNPQIFQRMKPTCCLYYQTEGAANKCYGCPRMSDLEREVRRQEIIAN